MIQTGEKSRNPQIYSLEVTDMSSLGVIMYIFYAL